MAIDPIRDEIMYWLLPIDVIDFVIATGIFFSEVDMARYTNIFKYIIPDRRWLIKKLGEGYSFTIFSEDLGNFRRLGRGQQKPSSSVKGRKAAATTPFVNLVVRRRSRFVPCTYNFAPTSVFSISRNCTDGGKKDPKHYGKHASRHIELPRGLSALKIICPPISQSSPKVMKLGSRYPFRKLHSQHPRQEGGQVDCSIQYAHMHKTGRTVLKKSSNVNDDAYAERGAPESMRFWCVFSDGNVDRSLQFRIDR